MSKVVGYVTRMQYAALNHAVQRKLTPGCSPSAHLQRLRRASIALGYHTPKTRTGSHRKTRRFEPTQLAA
jgi:hypothetical protein